MTVDRAVVRQEAFVAVRDYVDRSGYGSYISDEVCYELADVVIEAVERTKGEKR